VSTLRDLVEEHTSLEPVDVEHLHRLAGEWQLVSDLSFADLLMWVPTGQTGEFICVAQVRPTTWTTVHPNDLVSRHLELPDAVVLRQHDRPITIGARAASKLLVEVVLS